MRLSFGISPWCITAFFSFVVASPVFSQSYVATTLAGADRLREGSAATTVPLRSPSSLAVDRSGNIFFADAEDNRVRKISAAGIITTVAGNGALGFFGDGGLATQANLWEPTSVAVDAAGNLYIADHGNQRVRRVNTSGIISTVAGNGNYVSSGDGGLATSAGMDPVVVAVDSANNLYIADGTNFRIRKVDTGGRISTISGNGSQGVGAENVVAVGAPMQYPVGLAVDAQGNIYFSELGTNRVRKVAASGAVSTVAGNGLGYAFSGDNGPATQAQLEPIGLAVDAAGNVYVTDRSNHRLRRITPAGVITTVAGTGVAGIAGDGGSPAAAALSLPSAVAVDAAGNVFVADEGNGRIRRITGSTITSIAGTPLSASGQGTNVFLNLPRGVAVDAQGNVYVADTGNNQVRKVTAAGFSTILAGTGQPGYSGDGGPAAQATLSGPQSVAVDGSGNVYVADTDNYAVRRIGTDGLITTVAGGPTRRGFGGDFGPASAALIGYVTSVAADPSGNLYFNDRNAQVVRKVSAGGTITTYAGNGKLAFSGDNGPAAQAGVDAFDLAADTAGQLYIADRANNRVRRVLVNGTITTVAGNGQRGLGGDGSRALDAQIASPTGVAVDSNGGIYIADEGNYLIRKVSASGVITTIAGSGTPLFAGDNGPGRLASMDPYRLAVDSQGNVYVADEFNDRIRKLGVITATRINILSGDAQTGQVGTTVANPLIVQALNAQGVGVAGVPVTFMVTSGSATVVPATVTTEGDGTAAARVIVNAPGQIVVTASAANLAAVTFTVLGASDIVANGPQITRGGVVSAGASTLGTLSPNTIASIYGSNFAVAGTAATTAPVNGRLPVSAGGVCVLVNGVQAPLLLVTPSQVNIIVPAVASGVRPVQVVSNCGQTGEARSNAENVSVQDASPEFFYFVQNTNGINPIAAVDATTGVNVGTPGLIAGGTFAPARPGDIVTLYATGLGSAGAFEPGQVPTGPASIGSPIQILVGNVNVAAADIFYVGVAPGLPGVYQINLRLPAAAQAGNQPITLSVNGAQAPAGGYLTIGQ